LVKLRDKISEAQKDSIQSAIIEIQYSHGLSPFGHKMTSDKHAFVVGIIVICYLIKHLIWNFSKTLTKITQ
jgi:hypothetical protein